MFRVCRASALASRGLTPGHYARQNLSLLRQFSLLRKTPQLYALLANQCPSAHDNTESRVALSLSPNPSAIVMGTFPRDQIDSYEQAAKYSDESRDEMGTADEDLDARSLVVKDFREVPEFLKIAQSTIGQYIDQCPYYSHLAEAQAGEEDLYFHVFDLRAPPPAGRIPYVEDILGTVRLQDGKIVVGSYEPNWMYRVVTHSGVFTISDFLTKKVRKALEDEAMHSN